MPDVLTMDMDLDLPCKLSDQSVDALAVELANTVQTLEQVDARRKEVAAEYREQMKSLRAKANDCSRKVVERRYMAVVPATVKYDWKRGAKTITRKDTGETWEEGLTDPERQQTLVAPTFQPAGAEPNDSKRCTCPAAEIVMPGETWGCAKHGQLVMGADGATAQRGAQAPADEPAPARPENCECPEKPLKVEAGTKWSCPAHGPMWKDAFGKFASRPTEG